ncbi:MAG: DNA primase [Deltaproteobacteria bacterium]|nr:DNA primase [Deltaproteobacteria bacterium]
MTGYVSQEKIDEIRDRVDIVHLISEYVTLKKMGRNFTGLCPFHKEKTPSFTVRPDKQIFFCFGCGLGGNAFSFLMHINGMTFPEAIRYLASKTGVSLPGSPSHARTAARSSEKEQIYLVNKEASQWFVRNLAMKENASIRAYLGNRGITPGVIEAFSLGYAPNNWSGLRNHFERGKIAVEWAEKAGLVVTGREGSYYDRFRGRLMIPIEDTEGRIIAFGGRLLDQGEPKYLNSPETPVYIKGRCLYGLSKSREYIRKEGHAILVEGYFDFLSLWGAGIHSVVASLGTALTQEQVALLRRYTQKVFVAFDADVAGQRALMRSFELFLAADIDALAVTLPAGGDPDNFIRAYGKEGFLEAIGAAQPLETYCLDQLWGGEKTLIGEKNAVKKAVQLSLNITDPIARNLFLRRISERFGVDYEVLQREVRGTQNISLPPASNRQTDSHKGSVADRVDKLELSIVHLMLEKPNKIRRVVEDNALTYFSEGSLKVLAEQIATTVGRDGRGMIDLDGLVGLLDRPSIREAVLRLVMEEQPISDELADRIYDDVLNKLRRRWFKKKRGNLQAKLVKAQQDRNETLQLTLIQEIEYLVQEEKKRVVGNHGDILKFRERANG